VTSLRQVDANRRCPPTHRTHHRAGKHRSRRNAVRHGLCAETVVGTLEDMEDYKGFEAATQTVRAVPCSTAAKETGGTITCTGIPEGSTGPKRRKHKDRAKLVSCEATPSRQIAF
jgi:hypothetical protein